MEIKKSSDGSALTMNLIGRLDAVTALEFEEEFNNSISGIDELTLNFEKLDYISSAGLRILLKMQKKMDQIGKMKICNLKKEVREVIDMTGFSGFLTLEEKKSGFSVDF